MAITLDPATEQRIQTELSRGSFSKPSELLTHALDLVKAEEDWLLRNKTSIASHLQKSFDQSQRGETYSPEEARALLAERRAAHSAR